MCAKASPAPFHTILTHYHTMTTYTTMSSGHSTKTTVVVESHHDNQAIIRSFIIFLTGNTNTISTLRKMNHALTPVFVDADVCLSVVAGEGKL